MEVTPRVLHSALKIVLGAVELLVFTFIPHYDSLLLSLLLVFLFLLELYVVFKK